MTTNGRHEYEVALLGHDRWRLLAGAWPLSFVVLGLLMMLSGDTSFVWFLLVGLFLGAGTLRRAFDDNAEPDLLPTQLVIDGRRIIVDGGAYDIGRIRTGYLLPGDPPRIRIHFAERRLPVDIAFASHEQAEEVLEAIDLSPRQRVASFRSFAPHARGPVAALVTFAIVGCFVALYTTVGRIEILVPVMFLLTYLTRMWRRNVHVGSDGVRIERGVRFDRFVAHDDIVATEYEHTSQQNEVHVLLRIDGDDDARVGFRSEQQAGAFLAAVEWARQRRDEAQPVAGALARGDAEPSEWVKRLRVATQMGAHRTAALAREQLWSLVEGTSVQPLQRAAAAVALSGQLDEPARKRIEDVAAATASPRLRVVLDAVQQDAEDEAVAEALAALAEEEDQRA